MSQQAPPLRPVFAGTPDFAASHLRALLAAGVEVAAVYTQPDRPTGRGKKLLPGPVKQLALEHEIPVYQPASLKGDDEQRALAALQPDIMVVVAYGLLLPPAVLAIPRHGCINVHASLLPRWRGAAPIQRAIEAGDRETGVTIMQMDAGLDTGDMLLKSRCSIADTDTAASLQDKLAQLGPDALLTTLAAIADGTVVGEPQDDGLSTYAPKITKAEAAIDWALPAPVIERRIRAFNPVPVAHTLLDGQSLRIWSARALTGDSGKPPGTIVAGDSGDTELQVACGEGILAITELQLPGKKRLAAADVIRGHGHLLAPGKRFGP